MDQQWSPRLFSDFHKQEHDACGIVSCIEKERIPTRNNIFTCIDALVTMNHRAGFINGEGDGVGIHIDIPRALWKKKLEQQGLDAELAESETFIVGHFFLSRQFETATLQQEIKEKMLQAGLPILFESTEVHNPSALGPIAIQENPVFWQIACHSDTQDQKQLSKTLFTLIQTIEDNDYIHVASLSQYHAVYKVMGAGHILPQYYSDLADPLVASTMTLGHNRYSTNTLSSFFRVQPFSVLGHNGEINTIARLRKEAKMAGVHLVKDGSDSQDLSRTIETFICEHGFSLFEAMDIVFPPIINEMKAYDDNLRNAYTYIREAWGHFAQGPAGIISRYGDEAVFSVDALGLRPLWMLETESSYLFSSEPGIILSSEYCWEPKPIGPGEKVGLRWQENTIKMYDYHSYQEEVFALFSDRFLIDNDGNRLKSPKLKTTHSPAVPNKLHNGHYAAMGWEKDHVQYVEQLAEKGAEPIRSLGHDAPLAALNNGRRNVADFIKESVAVVTNPAIDRDRETEHFSTRTVLGKRPSLSKKQRAKHVLELISPILVEGSIGNECSSLINQPSYDSVVSYFKDKGLSHTLSCAFQESSTIKDALERLGEQAKAAVLDGASLLILDDGSAHQDGNLWIDPLLATSVVDRALSEANVRRDCSILLRSGAIRSLHDLMTVYGLGADAINPYYMFLTVSGEEIKPVVNLFTGLNKGIEKVISTIGIHELRGYGRLFSAIGLNEEIASQLGIVNFLGSDDLAYDFELLKNDALQRAEDFQNEKAKMGRPYSLLPRIWKAIGEVAATGKYDTYRDKIAEHETGTPTSIRHLTTFKQGNKQIQPSDVNIGVGEHSYPFIISSMSFGSQNEIAFRAYAEAADRLNMISLNGEGGEIKDMLGKYPKTRGQQIASGRFGVNAELLNSSNLLEIKIGQGAKPGEGGHLPGSKVTAKIAESRNATIGSDLISPSNNHDIYSIEDLSQMILELKTANDQAKVAVKVPVVPNIGTIAVGIAKAGADIITLSGFDGGTGAARIHALQHVGLPVEIGVKAAHNALLEAGLRDHVELWADGGIKSANDVLKVMLLGANRVGFGTLSMIGVGCTACRGCHLDTCHVGIATQIESEAQAKDHGLRRFVPRQFDTAVMNLTNMFKAFGEELQRLAATLGVKNLQDAVGRSDLLEQSTGTDLLDLTYLLKNLEISQLNHQEAAASSEAHTYQMAVGAEYLDGSEEALHQSRAFSEVTSEQRVLGSRVSCHRVRGRLDGSYKTLPPVSLSYADGSIPGNGLGAYNSSGIDIRVSGGAQDGIGKTSFGGNIMVFKSKGKDGHMYNGSVGKGFGYGAQKGLLIAQGNADARAGIRLSGADLIIGGQLIKPIPKEEHGNIGIHSNIKGFAFEYMTNGRGLVLGDIGPWACAGMTGGVVYQRIQPDMGLTTEAIMRRISLGAKVTIEALTDSGKEDITELLTHYCTALREQKQEREAEQAEALLSAPEKHFVQIVPVKEQADPSVSTE
ncbi:glutamate synthase-related protein [Bacillus testis]|uniref:glutamate synthase-related protein n=1 Tax=Bacillus testis TaxID=1622072 RepID=UPI00067E938C|nr:glutamate synthase-related protein [Bacillus testis]